MTLLAFILKAIVLKRPGHVKLASPRSTPFPISTYVRDARSRREDEGSNAIPLNQNDLLYESTVRPYSNAEELKAVLNKVVELYETSLSSQICSALAISEEGA